MKKIVLGLKLSGPGRNGHNLTPGAIGWAIVNEVEPNKHMAYNKRVNTTEKNVMNIARQQVGDYFKKIREEKMLSIADVAAKAGLPENDVRQIESGTVDYSFDYFLAICRALDCYFFLKDRDGKHLDKDDLISKSKDNE